MIIKLELENIGPYTKPVELDFRVNKKDKEKLGTIYTLPDGEVVTKVAGIIAGNAYGKTTILDSLNAIGSFISNPMNQQRVNTIISKIQEEEIKNFFLDFGRLSLIPVNKSKQSNIGKIKVEMYIDSNNEYSGYYIYTLRYDDSYLESGVKEEKLEYKKKYNSKKCKEIFSISNNVESEIGHKIAYKTNIANDLVGKSKSLFEEKIGYYEAFYNRYVTESSTLDAENYIFPEEFIIDMISDNTDFICKFINLADNNIKSIKIDKTDKKNKKLFFDYGNYKLRYNSISTATKKLCGVATNFYEANKKGGVFIIDELDNSLNKNIAKFIMSLYNTNIKNSTSQIIFTTNNSELLDELRRDQIFIIEKNKIENNIVKYLNFVDKDTNKRSRKDWSFTKAYNNNVIRNFPDVENVNDLYEYIKNNL